MKWLLKNEILKCMRSRAVRFSFYMSIIYVPIIAFLGGADMMLTRGFASSFLMYDCFGISWFWIFAAVVAALIAGEHNDGTIRNVVACGVERKKYFAVKVATVFIYSALLIFLMSIIFLAVMFIRFAGSISFTFTLEFFLRFLIYYFAMVLITSAYEALFIFLSHIFRSTIITFIVSVVLSFVDLFIVMGNNDMATPYGVIYQVGRKYLNGNVCNMDFLKLLFPSIVVCIVLIIISAFLFVKRDID